MKIYLDVCCLNRPFDDQTQDRIHLESEAVIAILRNVESQQWTWIISSVVLFEVAQTPSAERKHRLSKLCSHATHEIAMGDDICANAETPRKAGFKSYDALHLACARKAGADIVLSTDDKLVKKATQHSATVGVRVANPLTWLQEIL